jgi:phosphatidylglycerophosphate synthase
MSKLAAQDKFIDLSDYGRTLGRLFAQLLTNTRFTPIHVTLLFGVCGLLAIYCILNGFYVTAGIFLILKSIIDAADGELARIKQTPSYTGRYLDSVFDIVLNFLILMSICFVSKSSLGLTLLAFVGIQLQGTLYNYYYVILRNKLQGGDTTSKIFEYKTPIALPGEKQKWVNVLFIAYYFCYGVFDKAIHLLDQDAYKVKTLPSWFMSLVSIYGLGFQLLIMAFMLPMHLTEYIIPFFVVYSAFIFILIGIRKVFLPVQKA